MNKFVSTVILATFTAICSFGAAAGGSDTDKNKETMRKDSSKNTSKQEGDKYKSGSASNKDGEIMREKSLTERKSESSGQEVMNKKPYKE